MMTKVARGAKIIFDTHETAVVRIGRRPRKQKGRLGAGLFAYRL
jgi:hypothetical protein